MYPLWSRDGRELFYIEPGEIPRMISVALAVGDSTRGFAFGGREVVMEWRYPLSIGRPYDVSPDGQRFLALAAAVGDEERAPHITVVLNWFEELKARVPN